MTALLQRLLGVRTVRLRTAARRLGEANDAATALARTAERIAALRAALDPAAGLASGYTVKAQAATHAALAAASARQADRLADVEQRRAALAVDFAHRSAATDAVERAISRAPVSPQA